MTADLAHLCALLRGDSTHLPDADDGRRLLELARHHRVQYLLAWRLQATGAVPDALRDEVRRQALLDAMQVRELNDALATLEAAGAAPIVFKGAALAHTHYPASWLRPRVDADILIAAGRRSDAFAALQAAGYARPPFVSGDLVMYQAPFVRAGAAGIEHVLDVHWRVANPQSIAGVLTHEEIASRARMVHASGRSMRVPSPVDGLLLAAVHRAAHHDDSEELRWLYDVHLLAGALGAGEWDAFLANASAREVAALCARGLRLAVDRFHTGVPAPVFSRLHDAASAGEASAVFLRKDLRMIDRLIADLRWVRPRDRLRLVREHLFPPAAYMVDTYGVRHRAMLPVFYARRMLSGAVRWVGRRHS